MHYVTVLQVGLSSLCENDYQREKSFLLGVQVNNVIDSYIILRTIFILLNDIMYNTHFIIFIP